MDILKHDADAKERFPAESFPVACLNRDHLNSPKTAIFGGVQRARVSSQSWERAIRELARDEILPGRFKGGRSRYIIEPLVEAFKSLGKSQEDALKAGQELAAALATKDNDQRTKTLFYATPGELVEFARAHSSAATCATPLSLAYFPVIQNSSIVW